MATPFFNFFALFSRFGIFTSFLRGTCISFDAIKASMRLGRTGAFCSLFYIYYTLLLPSDLFQMGGQFHVFTVVHRHHDDAGHALPERFFQCGDQILRFFRPGTPCSAWPLPAFGMISFAIMVLTTGMCRRRLPGSLRGPARWFLMDVPAESVWFLRSWSCSYRSKQKRQSRPNVGRSAFARFIVLDFAAFHKG